MRTELWLTFDPTLPPLDLLSKLDALSSTLSTGKLFVRLNRTGFAGG